MGQQLVDYCAEHFGDWVRVLRAPTRLGLIKGKSFGAKNGKTGRQKRRTSISIFQRPVTYWSFSMHIVKSMLAGKQPFQSSTSTTCKAFVQVRAVTLSYSTEAFSHSLSEYRYDQCKYNGLRRKIVGFASFALARIYAYVREPAVIVSVDFPGRCISLGYRFLSVFCELVNQRLNLCRVYPWRHRAVLHDELAFVLQTRMLNSTIASHDARLRWLLEWQCSNHSYSFDLRVRV
jgi:hypothetical protein